jgi:hypothetical protein
MKLVKKSRTNEQYYLLHVSSRKFIMECSYYYLIMHYVSLAAAVDKIEAALGKFSDGPFFLGQFSLVCNSFFLVSAHI